MLELGCGRGGNLLPMAVTSPASRFVGIDLSSMHIAVARADVEALALPNIEVHVADIRDVDRSLGTFEFIADVGQIREDTLRAIDAGELRPDVLVAWGRDDPSAPLSRGFELYERLASASRGSRVQLHVFNRAGHYSFREQATDNNALLHHFNERYRQTVSASPAPPADGQ